MKRQQRREKNPLKKPVEPAVPYDKTLVGPEWGSKSTNEEGYETTYGEYGSNERGWIEKPRKSTRSGKRVQQKERS